MRFRCRPELIRDSPRSRAASGEVPRVTLRITLIRLFLYPSHDFAAIVLNASLGVLCDKAMEGGRLSALTNRAVVAAFINMVTSRVW